MQSQSACSRQWFDDKEISSMGFIEKILDALENLARQLADWLTGPEVEPEVEAIPIPVRDRQYR